MAVVYISEHDKPQVSYGNLMPMATMPPLVSQVVSITAGSVQSSAFGASTYMVGVHTDAICSVAFGTNPTATTSTRRLGANTTEYFQVLPGHKIAVITNT